MKIASSFAVPAAADKVLALFLDPVTMQACIPGCEELTQVDETHYKGRLVNEVAHVKLKARFSAELTSTSTSQDTSQPVVVKAVLRGEDRRLGSTIKIDATLTITPLESDGNGDNAKVNYEFDLAIWGKLGRLGEGIIQRRTQEVEKQFAEALTAVCSGKPIPQRGEAPSGRVQASATTVADSVAENAAPAGTQELTVGGGTQVLARPRRTQDDWLILGLAVAGAFAYGVLFGGRKRFRK